MNLLLTNVQEEQSYVILTSLLGEADKVVVTLSGTSWFQRWSGMCAWSRHVSKRYRVPDCGADWKSGTIQTVNSAAEERYIQRIEEICSLEDIDVIYPSYDAEVYVFSKNRQRLAERGVLAVVPEYEALTRVLDKSLTLGIAMKTGFPVPLTRLPGNLEELRAAASEIPPPWVIKPRCTAHGHNLALAETWEELEFEFGRIKASQDQPMVQEFIPAQTKRNYYMIVNRESEVVSLFSPRVERIRSAGLIAPCAAVTSTKDIPYETEVRALIRALGICGGVTMQTLVDVRDGKPKLMEINPRFGTNIWFRTELGINEPLAFLRLSRGEEPYEEQEHPAGYEEGVLLLDPLWDLRHLAVRCLGEFIGSLKRILTGKVQPTGPLRKDPVRQLLKDYRSEYLSRRPRVTNPLSRGWLSDPLPPLSRVVRVTSGALLRRAR